jgi:tetratricopeptide (TPR) repeat protein
MLIVSLIELKEAKAIIKELGYLPLAIEQAGAYIWAQGAALAEYLLEYKSSFQSVTEKRPEGLEGYATVYTTWQISLEAIKAENLQAAELLHLYGFLSNDVPDELILHGAEGKTPELSGKKQLKTCIELLLSYSLVKREGGKNRVWIHPVVHEWTRQHLTTSEKQRQTEHALNIVFKSIDQHSKLENSEKKLVFGRNILPDIEACVKNVIDYLQDRPEFNQGSWKHLMALRDFLQSGGIYSLSCVLAKMLKDEHEICLGCEHPDTLTSMNNLASIYYYQGKYADAEPLYKEALAGCQKALGLEHPDTLGSMNNPALLYKHQGKYADAEPVYKEGLAGCGKALGLEHPETLRFMNNLALL